MGKLATFIKLATVLVLGGGTLGSVVAVSASQDTKPLEVEAAGATNSVRVYCVVKGGWLKNDNAIDPFIHTDKYDWNNSPRMNRILEDYHSGLYYYDIPSDASVIVFKGWNNSVGDDYKSFDVQLKDIYNPSTNTYKAVYLEEHGYGTRNFTLGGLPMNSAQAAEFLTHKYIDTCSDSKASGYNAYDQLNALVFKTSTLDRGYVVDDGSEYAATIGAIIEALLNRSLSQTTNSNDVFLDDKELEYVIIGFIVLLSLTSFGMFVIARKRTSKE